MTTTAPAQPVGLQIGHAGDLHLIGTIETAQDLPGLLRAVADQLDQDHHGALHPQHR